MSTDSVNEALTKVRRFIETKCKEFYSEEGYANRLAICNMMRSYLMDEDVEGFIAYTQRQLGRTPDTMQDVLEQLFAEVLGNEDAVWEEFEAQLRAA